MRIDGEDDEPRDETEVPAEADAEEPADPRDERIASLEATLRDTEARLRAVSKAFQEQRAEMASFRERVEAQDKVKLKRRQFEVVQTFFEPVQNLGRSLEAAKQDPASVVQGLELVHGQFHEALTKLGLEPVPGVGAPFDPNLHEALAVQPVDDENLDGVVLLVHGDGFMVDGRAVKASQVVVGRFAGDDGAGDA